MPCPDKFLCQADRHMLIDICEDMRADMCMERLHGDVLMRMCRRVYDDVTWTCIPVCLSICDQRHSQTHVTDTCIDVQTSVQTMWGGMFSCLQTCVNNWISMILTFGMGYAYSTSIQAVYPIMPQRDAIPKTLVPNGPRHAYRHVCRHS